MSARTLHRIQFLAIAALVAACMLAFRAESKVVEPQEHYGRIASTFAEAFPKSHLDRRSLDDQVASKAFHRFIDSLDYGRLYFLESDIAAFRANERIMDDQVRRGDLSFAYHVFQVFKERVNNRYAYVQELLEGEFDFDRDETYLWNRKNAPWAADEAAWDDLWRRKVKHELLQRRVRELLAEEAAVRDEAAVDGSGTAGEEDAAPDASDPPAAANTTGDAAPRDGATVKPPADAPEQADAPQADAPQDAPEGMDGTDAADVADAEEADAAPEQAEPEEAPTPREFIRKQYEQFVTVLNDYEEDWVLERYLSAFAHAYDPHSDYMSPASVSDFNIEMKLSLVGIGALLRPVDGTAEVVRLIPGGPAERDGKLKPQDRIIAVAQDGEEPVDTLHWPLSRTVQLIRGERGTMVTLTVIPASDPTGTTTREIPIRRDVVKLEEQAAKSKMHEVAREGAEPIKVGVIDLPAFYVDIRAKSERRDDDDYRSCVRDVAALVGELRGDGADGIVLDLRNNGGGSLIEAIEMAGLFIERGPVVQVKERLRTSVLSDPDPGILYGGPMVVLVNRLSASASEIVAGALQDYGRAVIVGDQQTHGKGTVQTVLGLDGDDTDLGSIKVTTASFYRVRGGSTQLKGVAPDIVVSSSYDSMDIGEGALEDPLPWTMVRGVNFKPFSNLRPAVRALREKSEARRAEDERYIRRRELLDHLAEMRRKHEVSLRLEDALAFARMEERLRKLQETDAPDDAKRPDVKDLVLVEGLNIMADLIVYQNRALEAASAR